MSRKNLTLSFFKTHFIRSAMYCDAMSNLITNLGRHIERYHPRVLKVHILLYESWQKIPVDGIADTCGTN